MDFVVEGVWDGVSLPDALGVHEIKDDARFGWPNGIPDYIQVSSSGSSA